MNHTFMTTDTAYMASSASGALEGDFLCILFGCREPAVLRPCGIDDTGEEFYELIAFAWTHGVMAGEFVKDGDFKRQTFVLQEGRRQGNHQQHGSRIRDSARKAHVWTSRLLI